LSKQFLDGYFQIFKNDKNSLEWWIKTVGVKVQTSFKTLFFKLPGRNYPQVEE